MIVLGCKTPLIECFQNDIVYDYWICQKDLYFWKVHFNIDFLDFFYGWLIYRLWWWWEQHILMKWIKLNNKHNFVNWFYEIILRLISLVWASKDFGAKIVNVMIVSIWNLDLEVEITFCDSSQNIWINYLWVGWYLFRISNIKWIVCMSHIFTNCAIFLSYCWFDEKSKKSPLDLSGRFYGLILSWFNHKMIELLLSEFVG